MDLTIFVKKLRSVFLAAGFARHFQVVFEDFGGHCLSLGMVSIKVSRW